MVAARTRKSCCQIIGIASKVNIASSDVVGPLCRAPCAGLEPAHIFLLEKCR